MSSKSNVSEGLNPSSNGTIYAFSNDAVANKLMSMGATIGSELQVLRPAPFGGGYYVKVNGNNIALRRQEADCIQLIEQ